MFLKLMTVFVLLLTFLATYVNSQRSFFDLFQAGGGGGGGGGEHGGEHGPNIHTLFKYGSPSYNGINNEQQHSAPVTNNIGNPYYQQQQQFYRYPQNYNYPQQYYYG